MPALAAWSVIPFADGVVLADVDAGLLLVVALNAISVYGILLAGSASNSKYALFGGLRAAAPTISYEIPIGFDVAGEVAMFGTLNQTAIVGAQARSIQS